MRTFSRSNVTHPSDIWSSDTHSNDTRARNTLSSSAQFTPTPSTKSQTSDHRTSVESCYPNLSKVNRLSAQSLEKVLSGMLAEFYAAESPEPLKNALSRFTFSCNGSDTSMKIMTRAPTFSMQDIFRYTLGQQIQTLNLDRTYAHLEKDRPIQISIVGEKAKDAVSEWVDKTFGKRKQKWDGDCYIDVKVTASYDTSVWDVTFRLHVPKKLSKAKDLENLHLHLAVFFFDKADIKTLENIAKHFKTPQSSQCILLGLDSANELTKLETRRPAGRKFDVEPVCKADVEKALVDSEAALCIECARNHDVALKKLFSVLFCVALSARQMSGRRNSSR
ncbi:hypothetical protein BDV97DRAFT_366456 [Delphinella strobiligena]|nr:hypothetical protein BDV97DRAFT_366456 [Delphinella strobiligena]